MKSQTGRARGCKKKMDVNRSIRRTAQIRSSRKFFFFFWRETTANTLGAFEPPRLLRFLPFFHRRPRFSPAKFHTRKWEKNHRCEKKEQKKSSEDVRAIIELNPMIVASGERKYFATKPRRRSPPHPDPSHAQTKTI